MIVFDLQCAKGHRFEGWFEERRSFELQQRESLIACPVCGDRDISKMPSTFAIKTSRPAGEGVGALETLSRQIGDYVREHFHDVGADFSREALKIHYGVAEPRNIRGVSTQAEEQTLKKEGVQFFKIPMPVNTENDPQ